MERSDHICATLLVVNRADLAAALRAITLDLSAPMFDRLTVVDELDWLGVLPAAAVVPISVCEKAPVCRCRLHCQWVGDMQRQR